MDLGQRIKQLRKQQGMTQAELAAKIHTSERYIGHIESGWRRPKLDKVLLLSAAFGVSLDELIQPQEAATSAA